MAKIAGDESTLTRTEEAHKEPEQFRVLIYNDDYTPMDFVVDIIVSVFQKSSAEATRIMLDVHRKGKGVLGVYTWDVAASKVERVHREARADGYPLRAGMEPA